MFLTVRGKKESAAVIRAKIVFAWCAASCVGYRSQPLTEPLRHRGDAWQFQRDSSAQIWKFKPPAVSSTATQKPKNQSPDSWTHGCCCTQSTFLPPLSAASGASPAAEGTKPAHSDAHQSRPVSQQRTSSAPNLLASISAVRNSLNSSSALTKMLHEIT